MRTREDISVGQKRKEVAVAPPFIEGYHASGMMNRWDRETDGG